MVLTIRKSSGIILRKASTNTVINRIDRADSLFNKLIVRSVVENTLGLPAGTLDCTSSKIMFYPVWTMKSDTREKIVKKIAVKRSSDKDYAFIDELRLADYGLKTYGELLRCFVESGAAQQSGLQDFYIKFRANDRRKIKE